MKKTLITKLIKSINFDELTEVFDILNIYYRHKYLPIHQPSSHELAVEICDLAEELIDNELDEITSEYFRIYRAENADNEEELRFLFCYNFTYDSRS